MHLSDPRSMILALAFSAAACSQTITTIGGTGEPGFTGDGGPAVRAQFNDPRFLGVDSAGNVYVVDTNNVRVRRISPDGRVATVAGTGEASDPAKGPATRAGFVGIGGLAVAGDGTFYIASASGLQKVNPAGILSLAVTGQSVQGVAVGGRGSVFLAGVSDVSLMNANGTSKVIAGKDSGDSGDGGPAISAKFFVTQIAADSAGNVYVADKEAHRVRKFAPGGLITTLVGSGQPGFGGDRGPSERGQLNRPGGIAVDVAGNLYIADTGNFRVRRVGTDGVITTFAGTGQDSRAGDGGPASSASFNTPSDVAVGCAGVYVTDTESIRKIALTAPLIAYHGVVDAAGKTSIASGQPFSVSGCNFGNASVTINGFAATVSSAGSNLIQGVAPAGLTTGLAKVVVSVAGSASAVGTVMVR